MSLDRVTTVPALPPRAAEGHKGTYGSVRVVAGSEGMLGAAILCARGALRGGAGLVSVALPKGLQGLFTVAVPSALTVTRTLEPSLVEGVSSIVLGPGLGQDDHARAVVATALQHAQAPLVVDADGLNALSPLLGQSLRGQEVGSRDFGSRRLVITPHPGEAARLVGGTVKDVQRDRVGAVQELARAVQGVAVLKGAGTLVCDGKRLYQNTTGNPGMGTGGSGDVLAGLIGALVAQGMDPFDAAVLGVHAHGRAGDLVASRLSQTGLIAEDLPAALAEVLAP